LLISSDFQANFTPGLKKFTRYIDRVTFKGSTEPMGLYTIDMIVDNLPPSKDPTEYEKEFDTYKDRMEYEKFKK
jgi:hypothetical protein